MNQQNEKQNALDKLKIEVLKTEACTACGTCVSICPNIISLDDRIAAVGDCQLEIGRCLHHCPRTASEEEIQDTLAGDAGYHGELGRYTDLLVARSTLSSDNKPFQSGGVVSAILKQAFQEGLINCAVVTCASANDPKTVTIWQPEEILTAAGSKFALAPTNKEVNNAILNPNARIGVVALPCQATGLRKKQLIPRIGDVKEGKITLIIGLFCTWALDQQGWRSMVKEHIGDEEIQLIDIPPPPADKMIIKTADKTVQISLDEVRKYIRPGCKVCLDMTSENADVSVGMAEGIDGYNTVIVRSDTGNQLVQKALEESLLEKGPADPNFEKQLQEASMNKKAKAVDAAEQQDEPLPYYQRIIQLKDKLKGRFP
jgi:coenzyme F420 hydrogenase subunit beta